MDNLFAGIKNFTLTVVAALTTIVPVAITPTPVPTPLPTPSENIVVRSGEYSYSGYTLKYTLNIPKKGGAVTGNLSGVCEGPITGNYDGKEGGKAAGEAQANCRIAVFTYNLKATYDANLYLKQGKVDVNWAGEIPYTSNKGSFTVNFDPV
ncbi:hypothetical protein HYU95_04375 [Candidatus Daviesbacteria bacterium]|nr:hypothetical protein [Candidatus Daviesbacteria bacterium]